MPAPTHAQALKKLAADTLVQTLDEDVARLLGHAMARGKHAAGATDPAAFVLPPLLRRWNCVLQAGDATATPRYRDTAAVALAIVLHKYGIADDAVNARADAGIDALNDAVALSDDFHRKTDAIKSALLRTPPVPLRRAPGQPDNLSFHRAGDVVSFQLDGRHHAAYVHGCARTNESPIVEFYDAVFDRLPTFAELAGTLARGVPCNDGRRHVSKFSVSGMKFVPDPAGQVVLVKAAVEAGPDNRALAPSVGLYTVSDIFQLQSQVATMFA